MFEYGESVIVTEKLHGCNARFGNLEIQINPNAPILYKLFIWFKKNILGKKYEFVYGSHNVQKSGNFGANHFYGKDVWGQIVKKYNLAESLPKDYIFYGEIVGKGIQDLTYGLEKPRLFIFDIKNVKTGKYLDWNDLCEICDTERLSTVPVLSIGEFGGFTEQVPKSLTVGFSKLCHHQMREGIVIRSEKESFDGKIGRKILKSINPEYLLRKGATEFK